MVTYSEEDKRGKKSYMEQNHCFCSLLGQDNSTAVSDQ